MLTNQGRARNGGQVMPLTEGDVPDTLSDPVALGIEFFVDN